MTTEEAKDRYDKNIRAMDYVIYTLLIIISIVIVCAYSEVK